MRWRLPILLPLLLLAVGCTPPPSEVAQRRAPIQQTGLLPEILPPMKRFAGHGMPMRARANADIARDFLELSFRMESGRRIDRLSRFEVPVRVAVRGQVPATLTPELARLIARLRDEAGIDIALADAGESANVVIETPRRVELQDVVPQAACFVVPRVAGWDEFLARRRSTDLDWTSLATREQVTVLIPADVSPQEVRDCLHEEVAQALGPLNDLYELSDSVFNDDNIHGALTGFDMLILRAYYDPALHSGMTRAEVAALLPQVLARLNPRGEGIAPQPRQATSRAWMDAIGEALGPSAGYRRREAAARQAVELAERAGWNDERLGFALYAHGRLKLAQDPGAALTDFERAYRIYRARHGADSVHAAHLAVQLSAYRLSIGEADAAVTLVDRALPAAQAAENAALLSTLLMIKSEALRMQGRTGEAARVRHESLGWAQYGFGGRDSVHERLAEIAALAPAAAAAAR